VSRLLEIKELSVQYRTNDRLLTALDNISLGIDKNQLLGIVGESGCGKSTLGLSIIGLLPKSSCVTNGSISYKGTKLDSLNEDQMRNFRGTEIAMIFQEPLSSLNPVYRVGDQIAEAMRLRMFRKESGPKGEGDVMQKAYSTNSPSMSKMRRLRRMIPSDLKQEIMKWLDLVRIPDPEQVLDRYPFELSGGMSQRVMIAMALCQEPALLIADEPTTALDVTTQAQVLKLMRELIDRSNTSILLVTHDLAVAGQVADRVVVMYAGRIAEDAEVHDLFSEPLHPYTQGLLSCIPSGTKDTSTLKTIPGSVPDLRNDPGGCIFASRCPHVFGRCHSCGPKLIRTKDQHEVACFKYG
jgi:oligopeptide/dipeptide ABC transporter ATP-binding protein